MHAPHLIKLAVEASLYLGQAATYAFAFHAALRDKHTPRETYLASSLIHLALVFQFLF